MRKSAATISKLSTLERGFTLIEILVAVLILSLGVLGLIALESLAMKNNQSAYQRSQATLLAYDLSDRIRANTAGVTSYLDMGAAAFSACDSGNHCNSTQLAKKDLFEWLAQLNKVLPEAVPVVTENASVVSIKITWKDNREEENTADQATSFTTTFRY